MILWGWGERVLTFDLAEHEYCQRCEQKQDFTLRLEYKYGHFYHLFGWVISKQYQLIFPVCSHGWVVNASAAKAQIGCNPSAVPSKIRMDRHACPCSNHLVCSRDVSACGLTIHSSRNHVAGRLDLAIRPYEKDHCSHCFSPLRIRRNLLGIHSDN
ncbi:hypothetical protein [Xanthomonas euroxanthea]|uniref:hypothetical protein n=1 Tax=Xanthomonas euroxanthea TaxID=2259622 RepID=UPI00141B89F1|nr:hypothetical protein [Xanthomonas euroxanthea]